MGSNLFLHVSMYHVNVINGSIKFISIFAWVLYRGNKLSSIQLPVCTQIISCYAFAMY